MSDPQALPAVVEFGQLGDRIISMLEAVAAEIERSTDVRYIGNQRERAEQAAKMLRALKQNQEAMIACIRFELICLRRIVQLGASSLIERAELRNIAISLGRCDEGEFGAVLNLVDENTTGVIGLSRAMRTWQYAMADRRWAEQHAPRWHEREPMPFEEIDVHALRYHAKELVVAAEVRGEIDMSAASSELLDILLGAGYAKDDGALALCAQMIRESIHVADLESMSSTGLPRFVPVKFERDGAERWIRVPLTKISVGQMRWVLEYRRMHLARVQASFDKWAALVAQFDGYADNELAFPEVEEEQVA